LGDHCPVLFGRVARGQGGSFYSLGFADGCFRISRNRRRIDGYFPADRILPAIGSGLELKRWRTIGIGARSGKMGLLMGSHFGIPRPELIQYPALFFR
jgi:hypothetical protein